jgi:hypothetical protein
MNRIVTLAVVDLERQLKNAGYSVGRRRLAFSASRASPAPWTRGSLSPGAAPTRPGGPDTP